MQTNNNRPSNRISLHDILRNLDENEEHTQAATETHGQDGFTARQQDSAAWTNTIGWGTSAVSRPAQRPASIHRDMPVVSEDIELSARSLAPAPVNEEAEAKVSAQSNAASAQHSEPAQVSEPVVIPDEITSKNASGSSTQAASDSKSTSKTAADSNAASQSKATDISANNTATDVVVLPKRVTRDLENNLNASPALVGANPGFWARRTGKQKVFIGVVIGLIIVAIAGGAAGASLGKKKSSDSNDSSGSVPAATSQNNPSTPTITVAPTTTQSLTATTPMTHPAFPTLEVGTFSVACWATIASRENSCPSLTESVSAIFDTWTISPPMATGVSKRQSGDSTLVQQLSNSVGMKATFHEDDAGAADQIQVADNYANLTFFDIGPSHWQPAFSNGTGSTGYWRLQFHPNGTVEGGLLLIPPGGSYANSDCEVDVVPGCVPNKIG